MEDDDVAACKNGVLSIHRFISFLSVLNVFYFIVFTTDIFAITGTKGFFSME